MPTVHWFWRLLIAAAIPAPVLGYPLYVAVWYRSWIMVLLLLGWGWLVTILYPAITFRCTPEYEPGHCRGCGYNLTGNKSGICPECGRPITTKPTTRLPF